MLRERRRRFSACWIRRLGSRERTRGPSLGLISEFTGASAGDDARRPLVFQIERLPILEDYIGRLYIDYGKPTQSNWKRKAETRNCEIVKIGPNPAELSFPGYEDFQVPVGQLANR